MNVLHRNLLFCVATIYGFSLEDNSRLMDCLITCPNESCEESCNDFITGVNLYPQVDENTVANTILHCTGDNRMMIKFNPGTYVIEKSVSKYDWSFVKVTKGNLARFTNLTAGTNYRFRLYNLSKEGLSRPEISNWFSTFEVDYRPLPVNNISLLNLEADEKSECDLRAEVIFDPAKDRSCNYDVYAWDGEHYLVQYQLNMMADFRFELKYLTFGQNTTVSISSVNEENTRISDRTSIIFYTPTCLEYYSNLTICAPESVVGLRAEHTYLHDELYDLQISWDKLEQSPDNYTVQVDLLRDEDEIYTKCVPGNTTEVHFLNLQLGPQYEVSIIADSLGGTSLSTSIVKNLVRRHAVTIIQSYRDLIIGVTIFTIVLVFGMICLQYYKQKNKQFAVESARFEVRHEKDLPIETTDKLLHQDCKFEINNDLLIREKFELNPKLLTLKCVIGSGAYGIVRLGTLQDDFGNENDVAVKMLKDNLSVDDLQIFQKEIVIMKFIGKHPNIVSLIGCCTLFNKPVLVVEYCSKGDLQTYLRTIWQRMISIAFDQRASFQFDAESFIDSGIEYLSNNSDGKEQNYENFHMIANRLYDIQQDVAQFAEIVTSNDLLNFARQIATGMEFLSSNRIVHRDLAARNVLVCAERVVKISDFGLSRDIYQENLYKKQGNGKLPLKWMAIEALTHQIYTTHSDVWSFGILLWEIVTMGALPYPGISTNEVVKLLKSGYRMERPPNCGIELYNIMFSCWNAQPCSRPTFTELKESLDKLLSCHSSNKYLNMEGILHDIQDQYHVCNE